jgi:hypothetical protein
MEVEGYPSFDHSVSFWAKPGATHIELERTGLPMLLVAYQGANSTLTVNAPEGTIDLTQVDRNHVKGTMDVPYDDDTWAVGKFDVTVCK